MGNISTITNFTPYTAIIEYNKDQINNRVVLQSGETISIQLPATITDITMQIPGTPVKSYRFYFVLPTTLKQGLFYANIEGSTNYDKKNLELRGGLYGIE